MYQECRHIKPSGSKCHAAALRGKAYCYYHARAHKIGAAVREPYLTNHLEIPFLEDRGAVQIALSEVVSALATQRIEFKRASLLIYALQVASANAKNPQELIAREQVRESLHTEEGEELAPAITTYEKTDPEYEPAEEELTLAQLLIREVRRQREETAKANGQDAGSAPHDSPADSGDFDGDRRRETWPDNKEEAPDEDELDEAWN